MKSVYKTKLSIIILLLGVVASIFLFYFKNTRSNIVSIDILKVSGFQNNFNNATSSLQLLINKNGNTKFDNNFCIIKDEAGGEHPMAYVYWQEDKSIILWEEQSATGTIDLSSARRYWHLDKDVAADESVEGYNTSTYLVTRKWWDDIVSDCAKHGTKYVINSNTTNPATVSPGLDVSTTTLRAMTSKTTSLSKKICDSKIADAEKGKCYLQLAKETGDLGYCWKYQTDFNVCMKDVISYRHDPDLCNNLHPDSRAGCIKWYEGLDPKVK